MPGNSVAFTNSPPVRAALSGGLLVLDAWTQLRTEVRERASNGIWIGHDGLRRFKNLVQRFVEVMRVCVVLLSAERMCHAEQ